MWRRSRRRIDGKLALIVLLCAPVHAQTADGQPAFEVASIKPAPSIDHSKPTMVGPRGGPGTSDPGLYSCQHCNLSELISQAYGIREYRIINGKPSDDHRFIVTAKIPGGATGQQFRQMLQGLLAERFQLAVHRDSKEMPMHQLVVLRGGPKFKESSDDGGKPREAAVIAPDSARLPAKKWTMTQLANYLEDYAGGPVVDATGLNGTYDFVLSWSFDTLDNPDAGLSIFSALQSQLGLKLESKKGLVDILVIDHAEKVPSGN